MTQQVYTIIGTGQSNMVGNGFGDGDTTVDSRVSAWNSTTGQWETARIDSSFATSDGLHAGNNMAWHFAKRLAEETGAQVQLLVDAYNASPIDNWVSEGRTGSYYESLERKITQSHIRQADMMIFAQGEANSDGNRSSSATDAASYAAELQSLLSALFNEPYTSDSTAFIMPELLENSRFDDRNDVIGSLDTDKNLNTITADIYLPEAEIPTAGDTLHWSGDGLVTIGRNALWHAHLKSLNNDEKVPENLTLRLSGTDAAEQLTPFENPATEIFAGAGADSVITTGRNRDTIYGGDGDDHIDSSAGNDVLISGDGHDYILAGDGDDVVSGDGGNDLIIGGNNNDTLYGGDGNDLVIGISGSNALYGGEGDDFLFGGRNDDFLSGGNGNDRLRGGPGNDTIYGGAGDDTVLIERGSSVLYGEAGSDLFVLDTARTSGQAEAIVFDFTAQDQLQITGSNIQRFSDLSSTHSNDGITLAGFDSLGSSILLHGITSIDDSLIIFG